VATTQGVPITLAVVVAGPLCWGVIAAKPPHIALLQVSEMSHQFVSSFLNHRSGTSIVEAGEEFHAVRDLR